MNQEGQPVDSVMVTVISESISALTDEEGYYLLVAVPSGTLQLEASRKGCSSVKKDTLVSARGRSRVNFVMERGDHIPPIKAKRFLRVTVRKGRLRSGPSLTQSIVGKVSQEDELPIFRREGDWYEVETPSRSRAWIYGAIVSTNERVLYGLQDRRAGDRGWSILMKCSHWVDPAENTPVKALGAMFELGTAELETEYQDFRIRRGPYTPYNRWWIRDVVRQGTTACVRFGGDVAMITERSGSGGAQQTAAKIVFTLLEFPGIHSVYLDLEEGSHLGPGLRKREDFLDILPTPELESTAADHSDPRCRSLATNYLRWRRGE